uniref:Glycosyltransferase n=1 Tax=Cleretum bellidiforme TaxID=90527 RepID=Q9SMG6_CLEBE|nr:Bet5OGT [synthetic construct]CAB56231.1 betanidin-5-O-glucosyltransferase [Cleretum bellidiforme]
MGTHSTAPDLHVVFFPFLAHGHMIPSLDIAKLFAARGVKTTIITTPLNASMFTKAIEKTRKNTETQMEIEVFSFPSEEAGLPLGCENLEQAMAIGANNEFFNAANLLKEQLENFLVKTRPNCLVADMFFTWAADSTAKFNIPTLVFHGFSFFAQCAKEVMWRYKPYKAVSSDTEVFSLPFLPHEVKMTRLQVPESMRKGEETHFTKRTERIRELERKSYGVIVNSFYELEPDYADFLRKELGRRAWHIGPVSLCNRSIEDKAQRGRQTSIDEDECLKWLNSKKPDSVIYICFGSTGHLIAPQLHEIATALEASGQDFIWAVRGDHGQGNSEEWLPPGYEHRLQGKGLIIRGWAPQVLILEHEATGGFLTHCGWNSALEGISAGVPMVTWPTFAEQFHNEQLLTQILKVGVAVGSKKWTLKPSIEDVIKAEDIEKAVREVMVGEEGEERRRRAKKLKEMAWRAIEEGGSSYSDLSALIEELKGYHTSEKE